MLRRTGIHIHYFIQGAHQELMGGIVGTLITFFRHFLYRYLGRETSKLLKVAFNNSHIYPQIVTGLYTPLLAIHLMESYNFIKSAPNLPYGQMVGKLTVSFINNLLYPGISLVQGCQEAFI